MLAYTNHMQDMPIAGSRLYSVVTLDSDEDVGREDDKQGRPDYTGLDALPTNPAWPDYLRQRDATLVEQQPSGDHSVTRQTVSEPGSQSGDTISLSRDWGEILNGRRPPLYRRNRRRRVASAGTSNHRALAHGERDDDMLTMTTDAKQRRVILGNVPKYRQDDDGGNELQVLPFPGMLIQAFSAVDLDSDLTHAPPTRSRSPRSGSPAKKIVISRAKHTGAKLPKVSNVKRPLAAKLRLTPGETTRVSNRDRKLPVGAKPKLKYANPTAADRSPVIVLNGINRAGRKSEKHKPDVGDLKGDVLKGKTQKYRQKRHQAPSKREQNRTSISTLKSVKRTSILTAVRPGLAQFIDLKKKNEPYAHAPSLPSINEMSTMKSALKKHDRPAAPPKSVQFGAEYIREVTKIEYISDDNDDDDTSTTATELSDFSVESYSDVSYDSDDSEWRL